MKMTCTCYRVLNSDSIFHYNLAKRIAHSQSNSEYPWESVNMLESFTGAAS